MARIRVIQTRSKIKQPEKLKRTIDALGLDRPNHSVIHEDTPQIRGMIRTVEHMVRVEELDD